MNETTGKPRKRRRWLIAAVLLMAVSSVTWWNWPSGDARFVGTWNLQSINIAPNVLSLNWTLHSNGTGMVTLNTYPAATYKLHFRWRVEGNKILMGASTPWWLDSPLNAIQQFLISGGRSSFLWKQEEYDIIGSSSDGFVLRFAGTSDDLTFRRISE